MFPLRFHKHLLIGGFGLVLVACTGLGQVEDPAPGGDDPVDEVPEGVECQAELSITGTLVPPGAAPGPDAGCVPLGTWTLDLEVSDPGDCADIPFEPRYVYEVTGNIDDGYEYTYLADPDSELVRLKVTQGGPGDCEGNFEHYAADGMAMLLLKPFERDLAVSGTAYYETYAASQL